MGVGSILLRKTTGKRQITIIRTYTSPISNLAVKGSMSLFPITTDRFASAIYEVNIVADAFDQDKAIARANIDTVPIATKNGLTMI